MKKEIEAQCSIKTLSQLSSTAEYTDQKKIMHDNSAQCHLETDISVENILENLEVKVLEIERMLTQSRLVQINIDLIVYLVNNFCDVKVSAVKDHHLDLIKFNAIDRKFLECVSGHFVNIQNEMQTACKSGDITFSKVRYYFDQIKELRKIPAIQIATERRYTNIMAYFPVFMRPFIERELENFELFSKIDVDVNRRIKKSVKFISDFIALMKSMGRILHGFYRDVIAEIKEAIQSCIEELASRSSLPLDLNHANNLTIATSVLQRLCVMADFDFLDVTLQKQKQRQAALCAIRDKILATLEEIYKQYNINNSQMSLDALDFQQYSQAIFYLELCNNIDIFKDNVLQSQESLRQYKQGYIKKLEDTFRVSMKAIGPLNDHSTTEEYVDTLFICFEKISEAGRCKVNFLPNSMFSRWKSCLVQQARNFYFEMDGSLRANKLNILWQQLKVVNNLWRLDRYMDGHDHTFCKLYEKYHDLYYDAIDEIVKETKSLLNADRYKDARQKLKPLESLITYCDYSRVKFSEFKNEIIAKIEKIKSRTVELLNQYILCMIDKVEILKEDMTHLCNIMKHLGSYIDDQHQIDNDFSTREVADESSQGNMDLLPLPEFLTKASRALGDKTKVFLLELEYYLSNFDMINLLKHLQKLQCLFTGLKDHGKFDDLLRLINGKITALETARRYREPNKLQGLDFFSTKHNAMVPENAPHNTEHKPSSSPPQATS